MLLKVYNRKKAATKAKPSGPADYTVELLSEPEDRFKPDASAMFRALKNVDTLPHIKALRRMKVQTEPSVAVESSVGAQRVISRILRSLAFWKCD